MDEQELIALLLSVVDRPEDDQPRLVVADWFEKYGDPSRAEFIRAQLAIAKLETSPCPDCSWYSQRQKPLCDACTALCGSVSLPIPRLIDSMNRWTGRRQIFGEQYQVNPFCLRVSDGDGDQGVFEELYFRRGFVYRVACDVTTWETNQPAFCHWDASCFECGASGVLHGCRECLGTGRRRNPPRTTLQPIRHIEVRCRSRDEAERTTQRLRHDLAGRISTTTTTINRPHR